MIKVLLLIALLLFMYSLCKISKDSDNDWEKLKIEWEEDDEEAKKRIKELEEN